MTKLYARVTPEFKAIFNKVAESKGLTESEFLRQVMRAAVADSVADAGIEQGPGIAAGAVVELSPRQLGVGRGEAVHEAVFAVQEADHFGPGPLSDAAMSSGANVPSPLASRPSRAKPE